MHKTSIHIAVNLEDVIVTDVQTYHLGGPLLRKQRQRDFERSLKMKNKSQVGGEQYSKPPYQWISVNSEKTGHKCLYRHHSFKFLPPFMSDTNQMRVYTDVEHL